MKLPLALALAASFFLLAALAVAHPKYELAIPNANVNDCANCHINPGGGGPRNEFGLDFAANGHTWNATLAANDSDMDGFANGVELQDPNGAWVSGQPDPGEPCLVSNPGDDFDVPTPVADVTLHFDGAPVPRGTNVDFSADLLVDNCYGNPQSFDVWIDATLPNGHSFAGNPVFGPIHLTLPPGFSVVGVPISVFVPAVAPPGTYVLTARTGHHPDQVFDESSFSFQVTP
jgi:hypothetical protein